MLAGAVETSVERTCSAEIRQRFTERCTRAMRTNASVASGKMMAFRKFRKWRFGEIHLSEQFCIRRAKLRKNMFDTAADEVVC